jgi:hypothetical protein
MKCGLAAPSVGSASAGQIYTNLPNALVTASVRFVLRPMRVHGSGFLLYGVQVATPVDDIACSAAALDAQFP